MSLPALQENFVAELVGTVNATGIKSGGVGILIKPVKASTVPLCTITRIFGEPRYDLQDVYKAIARMVSTGIDLESDIPQVMERIGYPHKGGIIRSFTILGMEFNAYIVFRCPDECLEASMVEHAWEHFLELLGDFIHDKGHSLIEPYEHALALETLVPTTVVS